MRRWPIIAVLAVALGGLSAGAAYEYGSPRAGNFHEIAWPFPRDGWPIGRAFRCGAADCGADVEVYVRPKLGFCNCTTGVADDDEVDRVADVDMISARFVPKRVGDVIDVADMRGRVRAYELPDGKGNAVGIAVSHGCDLLVAAAQGRGDAERMQEAALAFLRSEQMRPWLIVAMEER